MKKYPPNGRRSRQLGQSLVEVCVACIALVPLAIGLVYVGQYIHIKQVTQMAARQAAWDAAVSPTTYRVRAPNKDAEQTRLRARYFSDAGTAVNANERVPRAFNDALLLDYSGKALLKPGDLTLAVYNNQKTPGVEGKIDQLFSKVTDKLSKLPFSSGGRFPPDANGFITARVSAKTAKSRHFKPFDRLNLDFQSQTVLLADAWDADGGGEQDTNDRSIDIAGKSPMPDRTVRKAITYLAPSTAIFDNKVGAAIAKMFNVVGSIPIVNDFFPMKGFNPGRTAPDVVPYDKLQPYKP